MCLTNTGLFVLKKDHTYLEMLAFVLHDLLQQ